jgi:hypothetical protein
MILIADPVLKRMRGISRPLKTANKVLTPRLREVIREANYLRHQKFITPNAYN